MSADEEKKRWRLYTPAHKENLKYIVHPYSIIGSFGPILTLIAGPTAAYIGYKYTGMTICLLGIFIYYFCHWQVFIRFVPNKIQAGMFTKAPRPHSERNFKIFMKWLTRKAPSHPVMYGIPFMHVCLIIMILFDQFKNTPS